MAHLKSIANSLGKFMSLQRASGVLLHPTSFPSRHGIGDLGQAAYDFIEFLAASGQKYWQILPLGPTGYEHSPYIMNFSTFAGNPLMISLEQLAEAGLLQASDLTSLEAYSDRPRHQVQFDQVIGHKTPFLEAAYQTFKHQLSVRPNFPFQDFCRAQPWLEDFALFMALQEANPDQEWNQWEPGLARREPAALRQKREELKDRIQYQKFLQFQFFQQWGKLRQFAKEKGIQIIGDISIYVCYHSADVWANPEIFQLDPDTLAPTYIAGVPPDYFSATGQLWGNPVYDWDKLRQTDFRWWIERFRATLQYADLVRIDHFRGFEAYWRVPAGETTAIKGEWVKAPGQEFFQTLGNRLGYLPVLAEDLGTITTEVEQLRDQFDFPGMKILQFAFGDTAQNPYLPFNYNRNCVVYPGTHDNDTALGWWQSLEEKTQQHLAHYLGYATPEAVTEIHWELIRVALSSIADLAILPLQDLLGLGGDHRMNDPATNDGNWRWRYPLTHMLTPEISQRLLRMTQIYRR
jgi:4-alpha-glucanotransferase